MADILNVKITFTEEEKQKIVNECIDILNERLISELENIKTQIDEEVVYVNKWQVKNDSIKIIDERISELKGENMADILTVKIEFSEEQKQKIVDECIDILNERVIETLKEIQNILEERSKIPVGLNYSMVDLADVFGVFEDKINELKGK